MFECKIMTIRRCLESRLSTVRVSSEAAEVLNHLASALPCDLKLIVLDALMRVDYEQSREAVGAITSTLVSLTGRTAYLAVENALHLLSQTSRDSLVRHLAAWLGALIAKIGDRNAADEAAESLLEISRRWP